MLCRDRVAASTRSSTICLQSCCRYHRAAPANVALEEGVGLDVQPTPDCHEATAVLLGSIARKDASDAHITDAIDYRAGHARGHCASKSSAFTASQGLVLPVLAISTRYTAHTLVVQEVQA